MSRHAAKSLVSEFAREAGPSWPWLESKARGLGRALSRARLDQMETLLHRFLVTLESSFGEPDTLDHLKRLVEALGRVCAVPKTRELLEREVARMFVAQERAVRRDPRYAALRERVFALYDEHPLLALLVVAPPRVARDGDDPRTHPMIDETRTVVQAHAAWAEFRRRRGREQRAHALAAATEAVCEGPYRQYLTMLWRLRFARGGAPTAQPPVDLGQLVDDTRGVFPEHVDVEAKFLRKAVAHRHVRYLPEVDALLLWNANRKSETVGERCVRVRDLAEQVADLLRVGSQYLAGLRRAVVAEVLVRGGVVRAVLDALAMVGSEPEQVIHARLSERMALALGSGHRVPGM